MILTFTWVADGESGPKTGALAQLAGADGCVNEDGSDGCADGRGLDGAASVVVSPDGRHVYVASDNSDAVVVFSRDTTTGVLTQLAGTDGCVNESAADGCAGGKGLGHLSGVAVSPDGMHVYAAGDVINAVAVFSRNTASGALAQLAGTDGCVEETGSDGCADGRGLAGANSVAVSPDGRHVYTASFGSSAVAVFSRNTSTGVLTQLAGTDGCVSETGGDGCASGKGLSSTISVTVSRDGRHVYAASAGSSAVAVFSRNTSTGAITQLAGTDGCVSESGSGGACASGKGLSSTISVTVSRDGKHVYAAAFSGGVAVFARNKKTGALTQVGGTDGCVNESGSDGCAGGKGLLEALSVAVSGDGKHVYVVSEGSNAVAVFARNKKTGALSQLAAANGCVNEDGSEGCADGKGLLDPNSVTVSPDGNHVYVASFVSKAVAAFARH